MSDSLEKKTIKGVFWSAVERFSVQGVQFILSIIIARLIVPDEYGLIAMLSIFMAIAQTFIDSGFSSALIQKKDRTEIDYSTVFYFNIVVSFIVYSVLYFSAPYISLFYNEPLLKKVTQWIGLSIIISAFSIVQRTKLTVGLDFKNQAKISLFSIITSGAAGIIFAYHGYGVWALVIQNLLNCSLNSFLLFLYLKWIPALTFSKESFKKLFSFGSKLLASSLLHTIYSNLYTLVIGKKYSAYDVGLYSRANTFAMFPSVNIISVISRAVYPVQCQIQDDDERLRTLFILYIRLSCFIVFPIMILLSVLAKPLVHVLLTERWDQAAPLLSILSLSYMCCPLMMLNNQMLNVKGRTDLFLKAEIIKKILAILILIITMPFGLKMLCWGILVYSVLDIIIIIFFVKKVMYTTYTEQIKNIFPSLLIAVITGGLVSHLAYFINNNFQKLCVGLSGGVVLYLLFNFMLQTREMEILVSFLKKLYHRK